MEKSVVLLSGGMDSTTALAEEISFGRQIVAVSTRYGSAHEASEQAAAARIVAWFRQSIVEHITIDLPHIFGGAGSALMGEMEMPEMSYQELHDKKGPMDTVVPFRNANLLSLATAVAITHDAHLVVVGAHAEDAHNYAYPDCTPEFMVAMSTAIWIGSYRKVALRVPFQRMDKAEIVQRAAALYAPLQLTWSCYTGGDVACGKCPTCIERIHAFQEAGYIDPVPYKVDIQWPLGARVWDTLGMKL